MSKIASLTLKIGGMHCASCVSNIEKGLTKLPGVVDCSVNLALASALVNYQEGRTNAEAVITHIEKLGYRAETGRPDILTSNKKNLALAGRHALTSFLITLPLVVLAMLPMLTGKPVFSARSDGILQLLLAAAVLFGAGRIIVGDALKQSIRFKANMNSLIAMGSLTAFFWSGYALVVNRSSEGTEPYYFESVGMIITLILLGRYLEARARGRAGEAIKSLLQLRSDKTTAVINGVNVEIDAASVKPEMHLLVRPGERVPADGEIVEGAAVVDESMLTGESLPVEKGPGHLVIGGSLNGNIPFEMKVSNAPEKSFLATVIRMVSEAQSKKAPVQNIADRVAAVFVPIVIGLAMLTFVGWYIFDPTSPMLIKSVISILIIACPCALGLATPTAILAGTGRAAREGIIIRGGDILEKITEIDTVIFDKTGTLTHGELAVVHVETFGQYSERNMIRMIGSAENKSEHPVAKAITRYMKTQQITPGNVKNIQARPGFGLQAEFDGHPLLIGNRALMESESVSFGQARKAGELEMAKGHTVIFASVDQQVVGLITLADKLRAEAAGVIAELKKQSMTVTMISGDNRKTAAGVARSIGLEKFEAEIRPEQKKFIVESFSKSGFKIAMVGDGINDAPALAMADVGIAVGSGTDVAMESADVVLVRADLNNLLKMFSIARFSLRIIKQNLFWAFFYNIVAIPLAAGLFYPVFGWTLSPIVAAAAMSFSSLFVVFNSLRLNRLTIE